MSPEFAFAFSLIVKMAVTAAFVVMATVTAERAGPLVGALVATLPLGAGPVYVFLALDHDAHFIARSATNSLAINMVNVIFALTYAFLAQKRSLAVSLSVALLLWCVLAVLVRVTPWTIATAGMANVAVIVVCLVLARPLRHVRMAAPRIYLYDLALRAAMVAVLVGLVVSLSFRIGPASSGVLAVFPVILISIMLIMHHRVGGAAAAAIMANVVLGLVGFALACVVLHFTAEPLGSGVGLSLALATSVGWSLSVLTARRHGIAV